MVNVYNRTSGRIKNSTVHCTNVCESRSCPFTDAETWHCGDPKDLSQPKKKRRPLPAGEVSQAAQERQEQIRGTLRGGMNIGSMGSTVSASENTALKSLLELADQADAKLTKGDISGLLLWCRR